MKTNILLTSLLLLGAIITFEVNGQQVEISNEPISFTQDFEKFAKQSETGKGLMLAGMLAQGLSIYLQAKYYKDNQNVSNVNDTKTLSPALPIAGLVVFTVGYSSRYGSQETP